MSATFTAFRALVRKDIRLFLRDRRAMVISVLTPIVVAGFFGFLFAGPGSSKSILSAPRSRFPRMILARRRRAYSSVWPRAVSVARN